MWITSQVLDELRNISLAASQITMDIESRAPGATIAIAVLASLFGCAMLVLVVQMTRNMEKLRRKFHNLQAAHELEVLTNMKDDLDDL